MLRVLWIWMMVVVVVFVVLVADVGIIKDTRALFRLSESEMLCNQGGAAHSCAQILPTGGNGNI